MLEDVAPGQAAERVAVLTGMEPLRCPGAPLDHLSGSFPDGWPAASIDVALERMAEETQERWVFPLESETVATCSGTEERTEVGVAADGTIVWLVPVLGRTALELPTWLTPAGGGGDDVAPGTDSR